MSAEKRHALGKGLSSLIGDGLDLSVRPGAPTEIDVSLLSPSRYQPRSTPGDAGIDQLAESIRSSGLIQPIIVRRHEGGYQIIAGERRWRAARKAGLTQVPIIIRSVPEGQEEKLLEWALIENIQREDLNPIDRAQAYRRLVDEFSLTQEQIAGAVGQDRSSVANFLRLLKLPDDIRDEVAAGRLSMGHARALLALEKEQEIRNLAREVTTRGLSVRETEQLVTKALTSRSSTEKKPAPRTPDVHTREAQDKLRLIMGTTVEIVRRGKGGQIRIPFKNEEELIRIYDILTKRQ
ncbi:MAG: ParB/RepB/Spo0J family partition protein [Acidobacteriota bacterium]